jgi:CDP-paratose synthetase
VKTILITGINGYLGSHLAKKFASDYNVIGLEYSLDNLNRLKNYNFKIYICKDDIFETVFSEQNIDIIIHTATFYGRNNEGFKQLFNSNLSFPFNLLDKSIEYGCRLFINTDSVLDRFVSAYALTKHQFNDWLKFRCNQIKVVNMQLEHFYGPDGNNTNFITSMINRMKNNEPLIDLTKGEQIRDFIYIDDVVNAYDLVIKNQINLSLNYTLFQVSTGELYSIKELLNLIKKLTKSTSTLNFGAIPYRENELMKSTSNNSELLALGWKNQISLTEGLIKTIQ